MWNALRLELAYSKPFVFGGLGLGAGVATLVSVIFYLSGDDGPSPAAATGIRCMFLLLAPMIVGFIAQSYRSEERRARLLLAGSLTPGQIIGSTVLLPVVLLGIGLLCAGVLLAVDFLLTGRLERESIDIAGFVGVQLFTYTQLALLVQEAAMAQGQGRTREAAAGWTGFVAAALVVGVLYVVLAMQLLGWTPLYLSLLGVALLAMGGVVKLYAGRTDFSK